MTLTVSISPPKVSKLTQDTITNCPICGQTVGLWCNAIMWSIYITYSQRSVVASLTLAVTIDAEARNKSGSLVNPL